MAASPHGDTPYSGEPVTSGSVTPYTTSVDGNWRATAIGQDGLLISVIVPCAPG